MLDWLIASREARFRNAANQGIISLRSIVDRDGYTSENIDFSRFPDDYAGPGAFCKFNNRLYCIREEFGKDGFGLYPTKRIEGYRALGDYGGKLVKNPHTVMDMNYAVRMGWWPGCGFIDGAKIRDPLMLDNGIAVGSRGQALFSYINEPSCDEQPNVAFLTFRLNDERDEKGYPRNLTVKVVTVKPVIEAWEPLLVCYRWGRPEEQTHDCKKSGCTADWFQEALKRY